MDEKDKNIFNNENQNNLDDQERKQDDYQTKRHYYGFGENYMSKDNQSAQSITNLTTTSDSNAKPIIEQQQAVMPIKEMEQPSSYRTFEVSEKKSGKGKEVTKYFLMFIASVLVVGLFMFMSDKMNWFTGDNSASSSAPKTNETAPPPTKTEGSVAGYFGDRPDNISELFRGASPAVVKIETYSEVRYNNSNSLFNDPFFRQFFGDSYVPRQQQNNDEGRSQLEQTGMGTGFFFDENGYILTNQHVIGEATEIRVIVEGYDEPFIAELLGSSFDLDLAVLKLNEDIKFPTLELGSSEDVNIGDWVVAIGNPYGFDHTLTVGVISAKERPINIFDESGERNYKNLLQTDASINPGNSGGPLINLNGQVIGINTAVSSQAQGIGFAIPTSTITEVLDYLKNNEQIPAQPVPFIGITMSNLTEDMLEGTGLTKPEGVRVENNIYGAPAYIAGINQYDIITQIDDKPIKNNKELQDYITSKQVGDTIELHIIRRGEKIKIPLEIGDKNNYDIK